MTHTIEDMIERGQIPSGGFERYTIDIRHQKGRWSG